jgi:hypothetical protein
MKNILSLIISGALVVSGFGQTRNVLVGTNNAVVQPTNFWSADVSNARSGLGLGSAATNPATAFQPSSSALSNIANGNGSSLSNLAASNIVGILTLSRGGTGSTNAATARTNLGLPWNGLTNSNSTTFQTALFGSGTNPVLVDSEGSVISPTNFWQAAPIVTKFIESQPIVSSSTNISSARFLHIHSLATNIINITNTIILSTNGSTFDGDVALIVHKGPTNSMTRVRSSGSTNDLITLTRYNEAIEFVYYNTGWNFNHQESFVEPIYFAGTNAATNVAASRANLGLGPSNNPSFNSVTVNNGGIKFAEGNILVSNAAVISAFASESQQPYGVIVHGNNNYMSSGEYGVIVGGSNNQVGSPYSIIVGGLNNEVGDGGDGNNSVIVGGVNNHIPYGDYSFIGGGLNNTNDHHYSVIVGGGNNLIIGNPETELYNFIGGGLSNRVSGNTTTIVGGEGNLASGVYAFIGAGKSNVASGLLSVIAGGESNTASESYSLAGGRRARATNTGSFVWADSTDANFSSTNDNSFNVRATGGMSLDLGTNGIIFRTNTSAAATRTNLGLGATWLTNANVANFRTAIGLGTTNDVEFNNATFNNQVDLNGGFSTTSGLISGQLDFFSNSAAATRTNLGLGATWLTNTNASNFLTAIGLGTTNIVTFAGLTNNGDITINSTTASNGLLYIRRTNNEPFLGLANLLASNNTTTNNETLFRVGIAEATNKSAQFGFRSTNTNGDGLAVFSTFGYNALMMVGPSDRSRTNYATNTNAGVEADIWSISPTNRVATLVDTNTGAFTLHRPIGFRTNETNASPTNAGNFQSHAAWLKINIGTNTFYVPVYQ